ncbi:drebrin-like protein [Ipomoea triloba]|uniref:drebrin-like protein n=1 Tax=Ipomoea triloba TaxID=35885 RepID=UPI00125D1AF0|nr:drebrin-like protein [Ipomoea triloba]
MRPIDMEECVNLGLRFNDTMGETRKRERELWDTIRRLENRVDVLELEVRRLILDRHGEEPFELKEWSSAPRWDQSAEDEGRTPTSEDQSAEDEGRTPTSDFESAEDEGRTPTSDFDPFESKSLCMHTRSRGSEGLLPLNPEIYALNRRRRRANREQQEQADQEEEMATTSGTIPNMNIDDSPRRSETDTPREENRGPQFNEHEAPPPPREEARQRPQPPNHPQYRQENEEYDEPLPRRRYTQGFEEQFNNPLYDMPPRREAPTPRQRREGFYQPQYDEEYYEPPRPRRNIPRDEPREQRWEAR